MLKPLQQFICDTCHGIIEKPEDGWVAWLNDVTYVTKEDGLEHRQCDYHAFSITHSGEKSPKVQNSKCTWHFSNTCGRDMHLFEILKPNRLAKKQDKFLKKDKNEDKENSIRNINEYNEFMRRLTIPYYDEARHFLQKAKENGDIKGSHETEILWPDLLKVIIQKYSTY